MQGLEGEANGTSTAGGILSTLNAIEGTADGTSTATGNLINLVYVPIEGSAAGTSTATADLTTILPPGSPSDATGLPDQMRLVQVPTPSTAVNEGIFFVSDGTLGLNLNEPYWRPESDGAPVSLYLKTYVEDLADTLIFGDFTGGTDIIITNGDMIRSENSGAGVPGRPVVLAPGSTVDTNAGALVWGTPNAYTLLPRGKASIDLHAGGFAGTRYWQVHRGDYAAIVGGQYNMIGHPTYYGGVPVHNAGIFAGYKAYILGDSTHSVILGGGANSYDGAGAYNRIVAHIGRTARHNAIVGSYGARVNAYAGHTTNCNFVHAVWEAYLYNVSYSACFGSSLVELGRITDTQPNLDMFVSGVFHDIWQPAGAVHGNEAMAIFGRLNDTYSATNGAMFGRFLRLGSTEFSQGVHGSCIGGNGSRLLSDYTFSWGGSNNWPSGGYAGAYSVQFGDSAGLNSGRQLSFGSNNFGSYPDEIQLSEYIRRGVTTDATPTDITPVGASPTGLRLNLASSATTTGVTWAFEILVVARQTGGISGTVGDSAMWVIQGSIKYRSSTLTTTFIGVPTGTGAPSAFNDAGAAGWVVGVTANDTDETLVITVTGAVDKTISWLARVTTSETRGGL